MRIIALGLSCFLIALSGEAKASAMADLPAITPVKACAELANADISSTVGAAVGNLQASEVAGEKAFCKVTGTISPKVNFEVRLPVKAWTQRFLQTGCGGLAAAQTSVSAWRAAACP